MRAAKVGGGRGGEVRGSEGANSFEAIHGLPLGGGERRDATLGKGGGGGGGGGGQ
jgi:hypothetical protein